MKHISNVLEFKQATATKSFQPPIASVTPSSTNSGERTESVNNVFLKFSIFYGHIWKSLYKNEYFTALARKEWEQALMSFDEKVIDEAIEECLKQLEMPPTLPQFISYCKQLSTKHTNFYRPAPTEKANPTVAESQLRKMKSILNMRHQ